LETLLQIFADGISGICHSPFYVEYLNGPTEGVLLLVTAQISVGLWPSLHPWIDNSFVFWGYLVLGGWTQAYCIFDVVNQSIKDETGEKGRRAIIGIIPEISFFTIRVMFED
jgi:hypothetical protein